MRTEQHKLDLFGLFVGWWYKGRRVGLGEMESECDRVHDTKFPND